MAETIRHYIVKREKLQNCARMEDHHRLILLRPTPWRVFLCGFVSSYRYAFILMSDAELGRLVSNRHALCFRDGMLHSDGDSLPVLKWNFTNVCKFCLEGLQYKTFWKFWHWRWSER